ncbi:MAG: 4-(cytidine 5'-diphospho)-2-C-methyl-D-erythritol kinase [Eubacteriales bacterium]|nr:4-(cytidine 5'-diphospho)-2-C-methyl-D-erythritol kinase [Eubacteriales bacterium]
MREEIDYNRAMILQAHAKINLTLDVLYKRTDGYHELRTVMARIGLADRVCIEPAADISVTADAPLPPDNTAYRAAALYRERYRTGGAHIHIEKRIPSQAGLGGASADAAAVLRAMQAFYGAASEDALYALGREIGADVPFCLNGGIALCQGVGERLTPLPALHCPIVLLKGNGGVSTGALFQALALPVEHTGSERAIDAIRRGDLRALANALGNALLSPAQKICGEIGENLQRLRSLGALGACMSGSGACVYGLFDSRAAAEEAVRQLAGAPFACVSEL